jgi:hypothetical protein
LSSKLEHGGAVTCSKVDDEPSRSRYLADVHLGQVASNNLAHGADNSACVREGQKKMERLNGKVAIVTGASRGIGAAIATRFAADGAKLAIAARTVHEGDHRLEGSLESTAERIRSGGGEVLTVTADIARAEDRERLISTVERELGPVDVLVNNAAVTYYEPVLDFSERHFDLMVSVLVRAPFQLAQRVLPARLAYARPLLEELGVAVPS